MATTISPQQRALNFGHYTRQHIQTLGAQTGSAGSHFEFEVPKARLLQAINLLVDVKLKNADGTGVEFIINGEGDYNGKLNLYDVLKRVSIDYNNGFSPVVASGKEIAVMNMLRVKSDTIIPSEDGETMCTVYKGGLNTNASEVGYRFMLEIPLTLNDRDPSGLVLAQNGQTLINFSIDVNDVVTSGKVGDEVNHIGVYEVKVIPQLVSFSIPSVAEAFPDLSVLKILDSRKESFNAGGSNIVKLPTGMIYRKLIIKLEDEEGNPILPDDITSNFELLLNTADIPYSINPHALRFRSVTQTGGKLPDGYYALDFSCQGTNPNYGGSRDYIDAETVTTFELRFTSTKAGKVTILSEKISRLIASAN